jgi:hypothetical protein
VSERISSDRPLNTMLAIGEKDADVVERAHDKPNRHLEAERRLYRTFSP